MKLQIEVSEKVNKRLDALVDHIRKNNLMAPTSKQILAGNALESGLAELENLLGVEHTEFDALKMLQMIECIDIHRQNGASGITIASTYWKIYYDGVGLNMGRLDRRGKTGDPDQMTDKQFAELMIEEQEIASNTKSTKSIAYPTQGHFDNITPEEGLAIAKTAQRFSDAKQIEKMTPNDPYFADHWMYGVHWDEKGSAFGVYPDKA